jgi:hypothetical protein
LRLVKSEFALLFEIQKCSGDVAYTFAQRWLSMAGVQARQKAQEGLQPTGSSSARSW